VEVKGVWILKAVTWIKRNVSEGLLCVYLLRGVNTKILSLVKMLTTPKFQTIPYTYTSLLDKECEKETCI
jgi:hypothetical protein